MKRNGFTLIEILISMTIVVALAVIMVGVFNAVGVTNKGGDAQRKKDLNRIKVAFEEYFNDKGYYPLNISSWNIKTNCNSASIFSPYLIPWPCDPNGSPYIIVSEENKFKVATNLENKKDEEILKYWYERKDLVFMGYTKDQVNYGVSSPNILWYDTTILNENCDTSKCLSNKDDSCSSVSEGCYGDNCFYYDTSDILSCTSECKVICCGDGCNE